jgi:MOSC domain-containing protein YiiM
MNGTVVDIFVTSTESAPMRSIDSATVHAGRGIESDRYHAGTGSFSGKPKPGRQITFIELEAIEAAKRDEKIELAPIETRRNVLVRGVALNHLVGREFTVGQVRFRGYELCEPCGHLEKLTRAGVKQCLIHRGGLRAEVLDDGVIRKGDAVVV